MCPFRFVLGVRELDAAMTRLSALVECSRDSVRDFPPDPGPLNYPCCILYSPLLPHYYRKMYEKRYDTSFLLVVRSCATRDTVIRPYLVFALQTNTGDASTS